MGQNRQNLEFVVLVGSLRGKSLERFLQSLARGNELYVHRVPITPIVTVIGIETAA